MIDWRQKIADIIGARCTHQVKPDLSHTGRKMTIQNCHWCHQTYLRVLAAVDESLDDLIASVPDDTDTLLTTSLEEFKRSIPSG